MLFDPKWDQKTKPQIFLLKAADLIEKHGLVKHRLYDEHGRLCAGGAIYAANTLFGGKSQAAMTEAILMLQRHVGGSIAEWNNAPERTAQEVINTLREAAE